METADGDVERQGDQKERQSNRFMVFSTGRQGAKTGNPETGYGQRRQGEAGTPALGGFR